MRGASLIVLAWNHWPLTRRCLDSLLACTLDNAEVIVVDNGSTDGTAAGIEAYLDRVRYVPLDRNFGFVRGMNAGVAAARPGNDIVLLNNDLEFTQRDWLGRLRDAAYTCADHGIVGCRLLGPAPDHLVFHVGGFIEAEGLWGQQTESGRQEREVGQFPRVRRVQGIAFALAYLRRDCIDRIGLLDERFHSYYEDTDYCLRARDAGIACVVAGNVTLRHHQHGSTHDDGGFRERLRAESRATFAARWQQRLLEDVRGTVVWQGLSRLPLVPASLARGLIPRLEARGLRVVFDAARDELPGEDDFRVDLATRRPLPGTTDVSLAVAGTVHTPWPARVRCAVLHAEWDRLPAHWVDYCNTLDRVIVNDAFQAELFAASGVRAPITAMAFGVDREYVHPDVPSPGHPDGHMVFLCIVEDLERDAPDVVVRAFMAEFSLEDRAELIIHVLPGNDEEHIREVVQEIIEARSSGARVRVLAGWSFPAAERGRLYSAADAFVSARRGGGWDPLVREAIASGLATIAPAWGSQQALIERWGVAVPAPWRRPDPAMPGCHWRDVDGEALAKAMRATLESRDAVRVEARKKALAFACWCNLDETADRLVELLDATGVLKRAAPSPPRHRPADAAATSGQVVVLGMHRSGTSSIGGLLALFGAWPGPHESLLRGDDNPKGHFEHGELHMACVRRLAAAGGDWKHPPQAAPGTAIDAFRREAAAVLDTLDTHRPWFIKEPRLCLLATELLPLLTHPVFVHVAREPLGVAASLARRDDMSREDALALWEHYTRAAFAASEGWPRVLVDYDQLVADPVRTAQRLHADLVAAGVRGLVLPADETILAWVDAPARHTGGIDGDALSPTQAELRDAVRSRSILGADSAR